MDDEFKQIVIMKNRGWRGLAEARVQNHDSITMKMIFSFSQAVWNDLLEGQIVMQDREYYYVITFDNTEALPKPTQQRSVLIKYFMGGIKEVNKYAKASWSKATPGDYNKIYHFIKNRNNHTTSDWNYIGVRVTPNI